MAQGISRGRFIRLGATMGAASAFVAACGGGETEAPTEEEAAPEESVSEESAPEEAPTEEASEPSGESIAAESDVAPGEALDFDNGGDPAVLVNLDGSFVAFSAVCTHAQCTVAFQDGSLACPCHGSMFDPANGAEVTGGPAPEPLPEIPVEVRDGEVFLA